MKTILPNGLTQIHKSASQTYDIVNKAINAVIPFKQITKSKIVSALPTTTIAGTVTKVI